MSVLVREATRADVTAMSRVLTASIIELCAADHQRDLAIIAGWTRNKTPAEVEKFFDNPELTLYVAERAGEIAAVGCLGIDGTIRLNYVAPAHRFQGVSKALLAAMEEALRRRGIRAAHLHSTRTAHAFYLSAGWVDDGPLETAAGRVPGQPMRKAL